ncbi:uncharacterized protein LOC116017110 [Ipomoea triloba]|uniref:uncharacterized protein LOC116017110 n=1 Tax=Ipomoea triloba TaxID=35885 RepID=UPI00125D44DF|nr:uncharacterized protein LOC116017110 [Ipomoea triloba]
MAAKSSPATAVIIIGDNSGEGEADDEGDDSDYPPRKFKKYRSIADVYQSTKPLQIVKATPAKRHYRRKGKAARRTKKIEKKEGKEKRNIRLNKDNFNDNSNKNNKNIIIIDLEESSEEATTEALPRRNPKFRSLDEIYEAAQTVPVKSEMKSRLN